MCTIQKLDRLEDAMKCFWKAHVVGDVEGGIALHWLGRLFERKGETEQAAAAYRQYIMDTEGRGIPDRDQQSRAYRFIAEYSLRKGRYIMYRMFRLF